MDAYKLHIKLGEAEFNAEGPYEIVQKDFEKFLEATEKAPASSLKTKDQQHDNHHDGGHKTGSLDPAILNRAYAIDGKRKFVSLHVLPADGPNKASDAALLVLYGHQNLLQMVTVPVTRLKKGLHQSGIQVDRIDRIMAPHSHIAQKGGIGVGGKYSLNNQGLLQAEGMLRKMFS